MKAIFLVGLALICFVTFCEACAFHTDDFGAVTSCSKTDRHGMYFFQYTEVSGNCGPISDVLVDFNAPPSADCTLIDSTWSDHDCTRASSVTCDEGQYKVTGYSTQTTSEQNGATLKGEATLSSSTCTSTYEFTATRR
jgi:hypothetical protein